MKENKYILKWREHVLKAADALKEDNREKYENEMELINEAYENYKRDNDLSYASENSFGVAKEIFENALPDLYVKNKKAIKEVMSTIKEDKNLYAQFMFLEALKKYKTSYDIKKYLNEAYELAQKSIDIKTVKDSNRRLYKVLKENGIKATDYLNESDINFYNDCNIVLTTKQSLANIDMLNETHNRIQKFVEDRSKDKENEPVKDHSTSIKEFVEKYNATMTESEKEILNVLLDTNENKRKKLFEDYKKNCLVKIKEMLRESEGDDKERLNKLYNTVSNKTYNKEKVFEDVIKMLEISDIFED